MSKQQYSMLEEQERELGRVRETLGPTHPKVAEALSSIGLYHHHVDRNFDRALKCFEEALSVLTAQSKGSHEAEIAVTLTDIGTTYRSMNNHAMAARAYTQAMGLFQRNESISTSHPSVQAASRGLALLGSGFVPAPSAPSSSKSAAPNSSTETTKR